MTTDLHASDLQPGDLWAGNGSTILVSSVEDAGFPFPAFPTIPGVRISGQIVKGLGRGKRTCSWTMEAAQWVEVTRCSSPV